MSDVYDDWDPVNRESLSELSRKRKDYYHSLDQALAERNMRHYVVGLPHDGERMAFIKKNRPEWQAGKLNGIGGKIEPGETPAYAIMREFKEETGYGKPLNWRVLVKMTYPGESVIWFFTAKVTEGLLNSLYTATDEAVEVHTINYVRDYPNNFIRNLHWIVPLAVHEEEYATVDIVGHYGNDTSLLKAQSAPVVQEIKRNTTL